MEEDKSIQAEHNRRVIDQELKERALQERYEQNINAKLDALNTPKKGVRLESNPPGLNKSNKQVQPSTIEEESPVITFIKFGFLFLVIACSLVLIGFAIGLRSGAWVDVDSFLSAIMLVAHADWGLGVLIASLALAALATVCIYKIMRQSNTQVDKVLTPAPQDGPKDYTVVDSTKKWTIKENPLNSWYLPTESHLSIWDFLSRVAYEGPAANDITYESASDQAQRIFDRLKHEITCSPELKIALLYAANNGQAELFHSSYEKNEKYLPQIDGGGQALLFIELIRLINQAVKDGELLPGAIRILPIATSLRGNENKKGNTVETWMLDRDLKAVEDHLEAGYRVYGIRAEAGNGYAIGGGVSKYFYTTEFASVEVGEGLDKKTISQGEYLQDGLAALAKEYTDSAPRFSPQPGGNSC